MAEASQRTEAGGLVVRSLAKVTVKQAIGKAVLAGLAPTYSWDPSRHY
jgi:hypothetical protein